LTVFITIGKIVTVSTDDRRRREREERQSLILEGARVLFLEKGVENTSMQDIADKVELSKPAIYLYFKDKTELMRAVFAGSFDLLMQSLRNAIAGETSGLDKLMALSSAFRRFMRDSPDELYFVRFMETVLPSANAHEAGEWPYWNHRELMEDLIASFRLGVADGSLRPDLDPRGSAILIVDLATSYLQRLSRNHSLMRELTGYDIEKFIDNLFDILIRGIRNPAASGGKV
jgi:AcrR family transcriptional regulator